jgi:hypothetical protein
MKTLNERAFAALNAGVDAPASVTHVAMLFADYAIWLVPLALLSCWLWGDAENRRAAVETTLALQHWVVHDRLNAEHQRPVCIPKRAFGLDGQRCVTELPFRTARRSALDGHFRSVATGSFLASPLAGLCSRASHRLLAGTCRLRVAGQRGLVTDAAREHTGLGQTVPALPEIACYAA